MRNLLRLLMGKTGSMESDPEVSTEVSVACVRKNKAKIIPLTALIIVGMLYLPGAWADIPKNLSQISLQSGLTQKLRQMNELERLKVERGIRIGNQFATLFFDGIAMQFDTEDSKAWARIAPLVVVSDEEWQSLSLLRGSAKIGGFELDRNSSGGALLVCPQIILSQIETHAGQVTLTYHATIIGGLSLPNGDLDDAFYPEVTKPVYKLILYLNDHSRVVKFTAQDDIDANVYKKWTNLFIKKLQQPNRYKVYGVTDAEVMALVKHHQELVWEIDRQAAQFCK